MRGLANAEPAAPLFCPVLREALHRDTREGLAVEQIQRAARRAAVRARLFQYRLEDRLQLTRRGIDDLQYLGRRGLLLQRLAQFRQQARVLDRDDRLVGKGAHKLDLPFGERLDTPTGQGERADRRTLTQQRHAEHSP